MPWRPFLLAWGVRRGRAYLEVDGDRLVARFGFWSLQTDLANVASWEISGPWRWWRAIGLRSSWPFRDFSFDTTDRAGITFFFWAPVRFARIFRAHTLTATPGDLFNLGRLLEARGIRGKDVRADDYASRGAG
ncbi:MAG: hypothetical protein IT200_06035 [Thermoleophilia bacterium]|nr:hypothetical protein [Thermoleophilia bacterium]